MRVAWAQLTQFDKIALMTGLWEGKLDDMTVYIDLTTTLNTIDSGPQNWIQSVDTTVSKKTVPQKVKFHLSAKFLLK